MKAKSGQFVIEGHDVDLKKEKHWKISKFSRSGLGKLELVQFVMFSLFFIVHDLVSS
jgi:hypothetical protein